MGLCTFLAFCCCSEEVQSRALKGLRTEHGLMPSPLGIYTRATNVTLLLDLAESWNSSQRNWAICVDKWRVPWWTGVPRTLWRMATKVGHSAITWWEVSSSSPQLLHKGLTSSWTMTLCLCRTPGETDHILLHWETFCCKHVCLLEGDFFAKKHVEKEGTPQRLST